MLVQASFKVHEVAALTQRHFLGNTCQLIQVRREVGYTPDAGLRKVVKFHACAQSDFRAAAFSATVRTSIAGSPKAGTVDRK